MDNTINIMDRIKDKMLRKKQNTACPKPKLSDEVIEAWIIDEKMMNFREKDKRTDLEIIRDALVFY